MRPTHPNTPEQRGANRFVTPVVVLVAAVALVAGLLAGGSGSAPPQLEAELAQTSDTPSDSLSEGGSDTSTPGGTSDDTPDDTTPVGEGGLTEGLPRGSASGADVSLDLLLSSADIVRLDLDDGSAEYARYRFSDEVLAVEDERAFFLQGVNPANTVRSQDAALDEDDRRAVIVAFPSNTDLTEFAVAAVETGAVRDIEDEVNPSSSVPLGLARLDAATVGPQLVSVAAQNSLNWLVFQFNENLDESSASASDYGYYTADGRFHDGDRIESIEDRQVTVVFDDDGEQVNEAVRVVADAGAARDLQGNDSVLSVMGGQTVAPDLISARNGDPADTAVTFVFDEPVSRVEPSDFIAYAENGTRHDGEHYTISDDGTEVTVIFPDIDDFGDEITLVAVRPNAADANTRSAVGATAGVVQLRDLASVVTLTAGPDLVDIDLDEDTGFVTFRFDELVDDDEELDAEDYHVISESGAVTDGAFIVDNDDDQVIVAFAKHAVRSAAAVSVDAGAVHDFQGTPNPAVTVAR